MKINLIRLLFVSSFFFTAGFLIAQIQPENLPSPSFNFKHGFYETPFDVKITTETTGTQVYYTTDGSEPGIDNGFLYSFPLHINTTTILRAMVVASDTSFSKITTSTYLFLEDVIHQADRPPGYPELWGKYFEIAGDAVADYGMDQEIIRDPLYSNQIKEALLSLPSISIVTKKENLFSRVNDPDSGGIYIFTGPPANSEGNEPGGGWERPASVEYFNSNGPEEFQIDCGLRIHGGHSRRPEKTPKHSFRILFKSEYGASKLEFPLFGKNAQQEFNSIVLRASYGNTWLHRSAGERGHAQLIHDVWAKDTQLDMGNPSGHGFFVHLYINGMYWGIYNPTERLDKNYAAAYFGGNEEDYDVIKDNTEAADGNLAAWNSMMELANNGLSDDAGYMKLQGKNPDGTDNPQYPAYLDVVNFIDYMIINFYGANWDWDSHNWAAIRNRVLPGKGFQFFSWDSEHILENVSSNILTLNNDNRPTHLFQKLSENTNFRLLFADRIQHHFFDGGPLTAESSKQRWMKRAAEIDLAIIAESARWGDYRRDVHRYYDSGPFALYTKENWLSEQSFIVNTYFVKRPDAFLQQLRRERLFPYVEAPILLVNGKLAENGKINPGDILSMRTESGEIYFTVDGTDPLINGAISKNAQKYSLSLTLSGSTSIKARVKQGNEYSALNEKNFSILINPANLKITEIHYHPLDQDTIDNNYFEFIELKNTAPKPIDLTGCRFEGIDYTFPSNVTINADKFIVLASDSIYFNKRYGFYPSGKYKGQLDNNGEKIVLLSVTGDTIINIRYDDKEPWPVSADGDGYSLVPKEFNPSGDMNDPAQWRASYNIHGSPGKDDEQPTLVEEEKIHPQKFYLSQNYPNPFNPSTRITYSLPEAGFVVIKIYNLMGEEVKTLVNKFQDAGIYSIDFRADELSSGIYFYRIQSGNFNEIKKMMLIR